MIGKFFWIASALAEPRNDGACESIKINTLTLSSLRGVQATKHYRPQRTQHDN